MPLQLSVEAFAFQKLATFWLHSHPAHHFVRRAELRADKLLAKESGGYGVHADLLRDSKDTTLRAYDKILSTPSIPSSPTLPRGRGQS